MDNKRILETLQMQPLSEEEKQQRHILGRLYGPIATCKSQTRNGRRYNKELWTKALADDLFKEKIDHKSLFLELGHPVGREETDMEKVCACIPEMPKIVNDDLYAYVDILDTANGRLLKTLCDYGFIPGISSRGSGDVMANNEVDPETFFLETWDIVQLPALKEARLAVCESLDTKSAKLKTALAESYKKATKKEKIKMKEALGNLNIDIEPTDNVLSIEDIPWSAEAQIFEAADEAEVEAPETEFEMDEPEMEVEEPEMEEQEEDAEDSEVGQEIETVGDFIKELKDYDKDLEVEFKPIVVGDKEIEISTLEFDDSEDGKVVITIGYTPEMEDNIDDEMVEPEEVSEEEVEETEEAEDNGSDEVIESLKEMVREKAVLEGKIKKLKAEKTVSDAEVEKLKESLNNYKDAFNRTSVIAAKAKTLETTVTELNEQIKQKDAKIDTLKHENSVKLTEGFNKSAVKIKNLAEQLSSTENELEETKQRLNEQVNIYKQKLNERTATVTTYKNKCAELTEKYISFRASMLGVSPAKITSKLTENYTINDIDAACESMLTENVNISKLPYGFDKGSRIKINESPKARQLNPDSGYDIDDSLLELAGLK